MANTEQRGYDSSFEYGGLNDPASQCGSVEGAHAFDIEQSSYYGSSQGEHGASHDPASHHTSIEGRPAVDGGYGEGNRNWNYDDSCLGEDSASDGSARRHGLSGGGDMTEDGGTATSSEQDSSYEDIT
jgi:hypothetical protein